MKGASMARIVIVDDELKLAEALAALLRQEGFEATAEYLSDAVVDTLVADPPDLIILDVMSPEDPSAGFTIARKIRATDTVNQLPIIMLTGVNQSFPMDFSEKDIDGDWMPVQAFLEKPVDPATLMPKIRKLLGA